MPDCNLNVDEKDEEFNSYLGELRKRIREVRMGKRRIIWLSLTVLCSLLLAPTFLHPQATFEYAYGGVDEDAGISVQRTLDGGYIIAGFTWSFGGGTSDIYVVKTSDLGTVQWDTTYGGIERDSGPCIQQGTDGNAGDVGAVSTDSCIFHDLFPPCNCFDNVTFP